MIKGADMEYSIYKLEFQTGVHFGTGMLNETDCTFQADQLFSALYMEAQKMNREEEFFNSVKKGRLLFSDGFPYIGDKYMVPKPMIYVEPLKRGESEQKKAYKKMKYLPVDQLDEFMSGKMNVLNNPMKEFGHFYQQTMVGVRSEEETLPFRVGTFYYSSGCGLYIIMAYQQQKDKNLAEDLLEALSYTGLGGKKNSGLGKYILKYGKMPCSYLEHLQKKSNRKILLSVALPSDQELEGALEGASYQLIKRSGFIASSEYADEWRKKKDLYVFSSGSCFSHSFEGEIFDVSEGGSHPVYRYAKALFMGV